MVVKQRKGRVYKYRLYKTYKDGKHGFRHVLVYQTDSIMKARDKYGEMMEKARTAPVSIVDEEGHRVSA